MPDMPSAANLRGQLADLLVDREDLGREMDAAVETGGWIDRTAAEDFMRRMEDLDQRIFHLRAELRKTSVV